MGGGKNKNKKRFQRTIGSPPILAKIPAFAGMTTGGDDSRRMYVYRLVKSLRF